MPTNSAYPYMGKVLVENFTTYLGFRWVKHAFQNSDLSIQLPYNPPDLTRPIDPLGKRDQGIREIPEGRKILGFLETDIGIRPVQMETHKAFIRRMGQLKMCLKMEWE